MRRPRGDAGTILLLTLGYFSVALLLVVVVVDVSAVYLARRSLAAACDGASLAAAQQVDEVALYGARGELSELPLRRVGEAVARYQRDDDSSGRTRLTAQLVDGDTVVVTGRRTVDLPMVGPLGIRPVTVTAGARARAVARDPPAP
ncbi:MAG TPA: pilus assembly protein TadG-related protein [Frankiaceae bacterium]|nr:pilus assembly protein TadG-related protein [Frankiaceae bacterium]